MNKLLTKKELAEKLGICVLNLTDFTRRNMIPYYLLGKKTFRYDYDEVLKAIKSQKGDLK